MKRKEMTDVYRLPSARSKKTIKHQYFTSRPDSVKRKSVGGDNDLIKRQASNSNYEPDDYATALKTLKKKRKEIKNITIESSRNTSKMQPPRPVSTKRKQVVGLFQCKPRIKY